jgi:hypothetical protein
MASNSSIALRLQFTRLVARVTELFALSRYSSYDRHRRKSDPRSGGMGRTEGTHVPGNDGRVAHIMPETSGLGGRNWSRIRGDDFANGQSLVRVTQAGFDFLKEKRPHCYEQL